MRLFEAIINANHRAAAGDPTAGLRPADFAGELPVVALTCIDPRLNALLPGALGIPEDQFIWLRNAGNIITSPLSSTMRSLALACAVKGGKEIAIIGHTDCQVARIDRLSPCSGTAPRDGGCERNLLPENLNEFFGMFGSERAKRHQRRRNTCETVPLIGPNIPVHGLLVECRRAGRLEWLVNGYETVASAGAIQRFLQTADKAVDAFKSLGNFEIGQGKLSEMKIGEVVSHFQTWTQNPPGPAPEFPPQGTASAQAAQQGTGNQFQVPPPRIPMPPRVKPKLSFKRPGS
jgi:carbonic anhydrase